VYLAAEFVHEAPPVGDQIAAGAQRRRYEVVACQRAALRHSADTNRHSDETKIGRKAALGRQAMKSCEDATSQISAKPRWPGHAPTSGRVTQPRPGLAGPAAALDPPLSPGGRAGAEIYLGIFFRWSIGPQPADEFARAANRAPVCERIDGLIVWR